MSYESDSLVSELLLLLPAALPSQNPKGEKLEVIKAYCVTQLWVIVTES